jgi:hypothetical protein
VLSIYIFLTSPTIVCFWFFFFFFFSLKLLAIKPGLDLHTGSLSQFILLVKSHAVGGLEPEGGGGQQFICISKIVYITYKRKNKNKK